MKTLRNFLFMLCALVLPRLVFAQQIQDGIYLTSNDYQQHHVSYPLKTGDKLRLNDFFEGASVSINVGGKNTQLRKDSIFGYRLHNQDFRIYHRKAYQIVDTLGFCLYVRNELVQQIKGFMPEQHFFFSSNQEAEVYHLTMNNLNKVFANNTAFRYNLMAYFNNDDQLKVYDAIQHEYKIKYLYLAHKAVIAAHTN